MFQFTSTARLLARDLNRLATSTRTGTRELLEQAVDEVARPAIAHQFQVAGEPPWEELAEATLERRERQGRGTRPLVVSGAGMAAALERQRWAITRTEASYPGGRWSGPGAHVRFHQEGARDGHFPARPFVALQPRGRGRPGSGRPGLVGRPASGGRLLGAVH
jgi:phage gpG-like protein